MITLTEYNETMNVCGAISRENNSYEIDGIRFYFEGTEVKIKNLKNRIRHRSYKKITSVRELVKIIAKIKECTEEFENETVNKIYKRLLDYIPITEIDEEIKIPINNDLKEKIGTLKKLISQVIENPNDKTDMNVSIIKDKMIIVVYNKEISVKYCLEKGQKYYSVVLMQRDKKGILKEYISFFYCINKNDNVLHVVKEKTSIYLSLKRGVTWKPYKENEAIPCKDEEIECFISLLKEVIEKINNYI